MPHIKTKDDIDIFYKDWGSKTAQPLVFHHGWPLSADDWDNQMMFFLAEGFRVIAHDRRGHGRSAQVEAARDLVVEDATTGFCGAVIGLEKSYSGDLVRLEDRHGRSRVFLMHPAAFLIDQDGCIGLVHSRPHFLNQPNDLVRSFDIPLEKDKAPRPLVAQKRALIVGQSGPGNAGNECAHGHRSAISPRLAPGSRKPGKITRDCGRHPQSQTQSFQ